MNQLHLASTKELLDELDRRCVGLILVSVRVEEFGEDAPKWASCKTEGRDVWRSRCSGSPMLVLAMQNYLKEIVNEYAKQLCPSDHPEDES